MRSGPLIILSGALLALVVALNTWVLGDLLDIRRGWPLAAAPSSSPVQPSHKPVVRIGVVSRFAPNLIYSGYQPVMDYLNRNGSHHYELRLSNSYQDAVDRLRSGEVAASFLGAWITSRLGPDPDLMPLVAPLNDQGRSEFRVALITAAPAGVRSVHDLRGRRVAVPSPQSWSGNWLAREALPHTGLTTDDLASLQHFAHHQSVVWEILRGNFDAGVVKESVALRYQSEGLAIVALSAPIPGPPLVGNRRAPAGVLDEISGLLLALDPENPGQRALLGTWSPEFHWGFTAVDMARYRHAFPVDEATVEDATGKGTP